MRSAAIALLLWTCSPPDDDDGSLDAGPPLETVYDAGVPDGPKAIDATVDDIDCYQPDDCPDGTVCCVRGYGGSEEATCSTDCEDGSLACEEDSDCPDSDPICCEADSAYWRCTSYCP